MRNVFKVKSEETGTRAYMQCKGNKKFGICTNNKAIRMDELEKILLNAINDLLEKYYDKNNLKELYEKSRMESSDNQNAIKTLEKEKNSLIRKIDDNRDYYRNLYEDKVKGVITSDMFAMMSSDYLREIEAMTKRIKIIENELASLKNVKEEKKQADDLLKKYKHIKELNKVVVDEFIDKIYIGEYNKETKTRSIEIQWNFDF